MRLEHVQVTVETESRPDVDDHRQVWGRRLRVDKGPLFGGPARP